MHRVFNVSLVSGVNLQVYLSVLLFYLNLFLMFQLSLKTTLIVFKHTVQQNSIQDSTSLGAETICLNVKCHSCYWCINRNKCSEKSSVKMFMKSHNICITVYNTIWFPLWISDTTSCMEKMDWTSFSFQATFFANFFKQIFKNWLFCCPTCWKK